MKRTKTVAKLEAEGAKLARLGRKAAVLEKQIAQSRVAYNAGVEQVILNLAREAGVTRLPIGDIVEGLTRLGKRVEPQTSDEGQAGTTVAEATASSASESRSVFEIFVKMSSNASEQNRQKLLASGLHWNGKKEGWTGEGDEATLERLRIDFPGRVLKPAVALAIGKGSLADNKVVNDVEVQPTDPAAATEATVDQPGEATTPVQLDKSIESTSKAPDNAETKSLDRTVPHIVSRSFPKLNSGKST